MITSPAATATLAALLPAILFIPTALLISFLLLGTQRLRQPITAPLPPGPKSLPIIGNLFTMFRNKPHFRWVLRVAGRRDITCIRLGGVHVMVVNTPELAQEFLKKYDATFASRPLTMATEYMGHGFLSVVVSPLGEQWKKMRRVLASEVINHSRLRWLAHVRDEEADDFLRYIFHRCKNYTVGKTGDAAVIDIRQLARYYSANVIRRMLFGCRHFGKGPKDGGPGPGDEEIEHVEAAFAVLSCVFALCTSDFMPMLRVFDLDGHERLTKKNLGIINKFHDPIIDERAKKWRADGRHAGGGEEKKVEDLLDVFMSLKDENGKPVLTVEEIKAEATELIFATVDNPSNIVEWVFAEMLNQPDILRKAVNEVDRVVGRDRLVQESDLPNLRYIRACTREALRLHPVAPFNLPHVNTADTIVAGYLIPKGSHVLLSRIGLGRNPDVWEDPLKFHPERHLMDPSKEVGLAEPELRFISFTAGRRGCMGAPLGTVMTYMLLARMLQAFDWGLAPGEKRVELAEAEGTLFLAKPLHALAKPRLPLLLECL